MVPRSGYWYGRRAGIRPSRVLVSSAFVVIFVKLIQNHLGNPGFFRRTDRHATSGQMRTRRVDADSHRGGQFYPICFHPSFPQQFAPGSIRIPQSCLHASTQKAQQELGYKPTKIRQAVKDAYRFHYNHLRVDYQSGCKASHRGGFTLRTIVL